MKNSRDNQKKNRKTGKIQWVGNKRTKNDLPVFDSLQELTAALEGKGAGPEAGSEENERTGKEPPPKNQPPVNRHGLKILDSSSADQDFIEEPAEAPDEDFASLLESSFSTKKPQHFMNQEEKRSGMPVKKRLKRYPPVEVELDLHGYTAIGAEVRARSFIHTSKQQGFFTLRIIVGKGLHSDLGPVLPDVVVDVVKEMKKKDLVLWYEWDKKKKIKSGALIVYLKQFKD